MPTFKGYHGYPASICASVNDEVVHGIPSDRKLKRGRSDQDRLRSDARWLCRRCRDQRRGRRGGRRRSSRSTAGDAGIAFPRDGEDGPGKPSLRCLLRGPGVCRSARLFGGPRVLRARDRPADARGPPGAELRHARHRARCSRRAGCWRSSRWSIIGRHQVDD